jgi:hypothetical protein
MLWLRSWRCERRPVVDVDHEQTKCRAHVEVRRRCAAMPLLGCGAAQLSRAEPLYFVSREAFQIVCSTASISKACNCCERRKQQSLGDACRAVGVDRFGGTLPRHPFLSTQRAPVCPRSFHVCLRQTRKHVQQSCRYHACSTVYVLLCAHATNRTHMEKFSPGPAFLDRYRAIRGAGQRSSVGQHYPCLFAQVYRVCHLAHPRILEAVSQVDSAVPWLLVGEGDCTIPTYIHDRHYSYSDNL